MMTINLTGEQVIVLRSLLEEEIRYLKEEAIKDAIEDDKDGLNVELEACNDLLKQINK